MEHTYSEYHLGLDIGTNSIGWSVMDSHYHLMRAKGKTLIGTRIFGEGKTAADRRLARTTRRRIKRRKWRTSYNKAFFAPHIAEVDPNFLARLKHSNLSPKDENKEFLNSLLFPEKTDVNFYNDYPTMYHLRQALMTENRQFDVREIYLAVNHIIKYRGNFLNPLSITSFKAEKANISNLFLELADIYRNFLEMDIIDEDKFNEVEILLHNKNLSRRDKSIQIKKLIATKSDDKEINKKLAAIAKEISTAVLGMKAQFNIFLSIDEAEEDLTWKFAFTDTDADTYLDALLTNLNDTQVDLLNKVKQIHDQVVLDGIIPDGKGLSESMIATYNAHKEHAKKLKSLYHKMSAKQVKDVKKAYDLYIDGVDSKIKKFDKRKKSNTEDFYKAIKKVLVNIKDPVADELVALIDTDQFMPKQRTSANAVIPIQMHQLELDCIIENQAKYYPWLAEKNPVKAHLKNAPYKLDELLTFRVPYYVGPMITPTEQVKSSEADFAWMIRKEDGPITPWNFDEKVDRIASANAFIKRMTAKDTYLVGEDVLPDNSLVYQRYKVLNELNNISINGRRLDVDLKRDVYLELFQNGKNKTVSVKNFRNFIELSTANLNKLEIKGLANEIKFNNTLSTYHDLAKILGKKILDDANYQDDLETIIEYITIFEDKEILRIKLADIEWLSEDEISKLAKLNYSGWGRLSKKLLTGIHDEDGQRIIDYLWNTQENFMQIQSSETFQAEILKANSTQYKVNGIDEILNETYTSPQNKKAIRQVNLVVADVVKAMGCEPASISIEFTRSNERRVQSNSRLNQVQVALQQVSSELAGNIMAEFKDFQSSKKEMTDRYFLYFTQLGKDMYTGEPLNIDLLSSHYDIDHILPQAFIKDDSLDNRVLTSRQGNINKSDTVPVKTYAKMIGFWKELRKQGLITERKLNNLLTNPETIGPHKATGFIRRQLVETSQVIKLSAEILQSQYPNTRIIEVRQKHTHELRKHFNFPKVRQLNDYHHAFDAYLSAVVGHYLYTRYPKLRGYFVYGDFKKFTAKQNGNYLRYFNFLRDIEDDNSQNIIVDKDTGEVIMDRVDVIRQLNRVFAFKYMLVSQEVYTNHGAMFNQSLYANNSNKTLIPIKENKPTKIYGGYSGNSDAYLSIVRLEDKKGISFKVVGIPMRNLAELERLKSKDNNAYLNRLEEIVDSKINPSKNGKAPKKKKTFRIILPKVHFKQLVEDDLGKFRLASSKELHSSMQLTLSKHNIHVLTKSSPSDKELIAVYKEIVSVVNKYFTIFDISQYRKLLTNGIDKFMVLPTDDKQMYLLSILDGLHASAARPNIPFIHSSFGRLQKSSGILLTRNAILKYQSPTGIFEKILYIRDL